MAIYTRTGDTGSTSLFGGKRVLKCEELVEVYGSLDELNSWIGHVASLFPSPDVKQFLQTIQSDVFTIGSTLAGWKNGDLTALESRVKEMEARIDAMEESLPPIRNFILPGGAELAAHTHITRSICRRVERQLVSLKVREVQEVQEVQEVREGDVDVMIKYLNRLSDLFFMLARFINKQENVEEVIWNGNHSKSS
ncbi:MAG: cob(I)yrinic acid a,c-diamide adenosyltransferase [Patescibacteria group bacterium]